MSHTSQPLVSVIIPAYNIENYISHTLEAVIGQTYANIEIVAVNDGSTDGTLSILNEYAEKDSRIVVFSQSNKGLSAARNAGFAIARGEYFCIIDADDVMMPEKIASQLAFMQQHPSIDFTYSKVRYFDTETKEIYIRDLPTPDGKKVHAALLRKGNLISPNSVFFKRSVFDTVGGFDETLRSAEDLDYWLFLSGKGVNFLHQDKYLTLCRMRTDSLTADSVTMYTSVVKVFEKHLPQSRWARITSAQYLKNRILLRLAFLRRPALRATHVSGNQSSPALPSVWLNATYHWLRRVKFLLTFKKIHDKNAHDYLLMIESSNSI